MNLTGINDKMAGEVGLRVFDFEDLILASTNP